MKMNMQQLKQELEHLLKHAGFPEEHYIIRINNDNVSIMFDQKQAVDYFKGDFNDSRLSKLCIFEYRRDGKRHVAYIYNW